MWKQLPFFIRFAIVGAIALWLLHFGFAVLVYGALLWTFFRVYLWQRRLKDKGKKHGAGAP